MPNKRTAYTTPAAPRTEREVFSEHVKALFFRRLLAYLFKLFIQIFYNTFQIWHVGPKKFTESLVKSLQSVVFSFLMCVLGGEGGGGWELRRF